MEDKITIKDKNKDVIGEMFFFGTEYEGETLIIAFHLHYN